MWGLLPLYFIALAPMGPIEIVALRILLSLGFCALLLTVTRGWPRFLALLRDKRVLWTMAIAGVLVFVNWQVYVYAAVTAQVVEASLGYFINPIVTVLLGVLAANAKNVEEVKAGNTKAFNALVGQAMKASKGKANPTQVNELLKKKLA